jgi:hypothetical protein
MGPDVRRYEAPHSFLTRLDAEHWLAEVHREIVSGDWRRPQKETDRGSKLDVLSGFARHSLAERDLTRLTNSRNFASRAGSGRRPCSQAAASRNL